VPAVLAGGLLLLRRGEESGYAQRGGSKNTATLIEESIKNSENGVNINDEVLKNFREIAERSNKVSQVVAEIAVSSEQQDQGLIR